MFLAFFVVLAAIPAVRRVAVNAGFVDQPGGRKTHKDAVPPIGGIVIFPVFIAASILAGVNLVIYWPLFAALALVLLMGAVDDHNHIQAWIKFMIQFVAAFLIVLPGGAQVFQLGDMFGLGVVGLGFMSIPFSVFCVVLLINAINLMDGLDGLAGGKSFIMFGWLMAACAVAGDGQTFMIIGILEAALFGFLFYNMRHPFRRQASVFLGDAGSMALGMVLAWYVITLSQEPANVLAPVSVAWIVALPVIDACGQFFRRMKEGRHPFDPDRGHFHHHLIAAGLPVGKATMFILVIGVIFGAIGYGGVLVGIPQPALMIGWLGLWAVHMVLSLKPEPFVQRLSRLTK
ncbi:MAG: undecaprenyl-phosphate alpha-N-acetylglucosaminyl 1-phosphate transferase [Micavibrio sp.]|nr:MAG: undecaprenyl-phosphate alpha-N-acetylglucosaminyl 1-phosphate transferase [Micavibrio sp.]